MVTIRDVAKAAGVSVATVSIVMNDKSKERSIPEATQNRITRIIQEMGYHPSLSARRLRSKYKQTPVIVFFWPLDFRINILASFLNAFAGQIQHSGFDCELVVRTYDSGKLCAYDEIMLKGGYSGIIIGACTEEDILHLEKMNPSMPVVLINRESEIFSTVSADNDLAGRIAADEFSRNGFTNAAVFASSVGYIASNYRVNSFISHCMENGITVSEDHVMRGDSSFDSGYYIAERFCEMSSRPEAVFCDSDSIALGALRCFSDKGIRVPDDVKILTVDMTASGATSYSMPSLSVIEMPNEEIGHKVIEVLSEKISANSPESSHIKIAPKLVLRDSFI